MVFLGNKIFYLMVKFYAINNSGAALALAMCLSGGLFAQAPLRLTELETTFKMQDAVQSQLVAAYAAAQGIAVRMEAADGTIVELVRLENGIPIYNTTFNTQGGELIRANRVYPGGTAGLALTGAGQTLGIWDGGGTRVTHQEFNNGGLARVVQRDNPTGTSSHATHVAGTMVAGGVRAQGNTRGMSYGARLDAYDWGADLAEMTVAAGNGLQASQHSYGSITGWANGNYSGVSTWHWFGDVNLSQSTDYRFGFYDNTSRSWDLLTNAAPYYLPVKSAGNDRGQGPSAGASHRVNVNGTWQTVSTLREVDGGPAGYDCITDAGNAKNALTVGAVNSTGNMSTFSGWGPTDDGRVKPDIVAKGVSVVSCASSSNTAYSTSSGTSMAGPMVSGAMGLLLQHNQNLYPGTKLLASTLKALVIHTANDRVAGSTPGPEYRNGWGLMDIEKAALLQSADKNFNKLHIHELELAAGDTVYIPIKAAPGVPLRATISWNDPAAMVGLPRLNDRSPRLTNDLDLRIFDAQATAFEPYVLNPDIPALPASNGDNFRDNIEMVHITNPVAGADYLIRVAHKGSLQGGSQKFSLIISGNQRNNILALTNLIAPTGILYVVGEVRAEAPIEVAQLVIPENQSLTIAPGQHITATVACNLNGQLFLNSNANGYAQALLPANTSGTGNLTQEQYTAQLGWHAVGATASGGVAAQLGAVNPSAGNENLLFWDAQLGSWAAANNNTPLRPGTGFHALVGAAGLQNAPAIFTTTGNPVLNWNPDLFNAALATSSNDFSDASTRDGWNLLANPFPASLDFNSLLPEQFQQLEQAYYIWNANKGLVGGYEAYGPAGSPNDRKTFIAPMQAFWMRANGPSPSLGPLNTSNTTVSESPVFAKTDSIAEFIELQIHDAAATKADWLTLTLTTAATDGFDNGLDARKLRPLTPAPTFFSIGGTDYLAINAINYGSHQMGEKVVPLGLMDTEPGSMYAIHLNSTWLSNAYEVFLEDQLTAVFHDLRTGPYAYEAAANQDFRFRLRLGNTLTTGATPKALDGWVYNGQLLIRANDYTGPVSWKLFDIAGKIVASSTGATTIQAQETIAVPINTFSSGLYMLVIAPSGAPIPVKVRIF